MEIKKNEKLLIVRYSDLYEKDSMEKHIEVLKKIKYVYFGKFGSKPSEKNIKQIMKENSPKIILKSSKSVYICNLDSIVFDKPNKGIPAYYDEKIFNRNMKLSAYFKLTSIEKVDMKVIGKFTVVSSLSNLATALHKSMTSMMLIKCNEDIRTEDFINE